MLVGGAASFFYIIVSSITQAIFATISSSVADTEIIYSPPRPVGFSQEFLGFFEDPAPASIFELPTPRLKMLKTTSTATGAERSRINADGPAIEDTDGIGAGADEPAAIAECASA